MKNKIILISILLCSLSLFSQNIDFLNSKYSKEYSLIIDESSILNHPFYSYLDCKNEGYFSIHFIPKSEKLEKFWSNYYNENQNPENLNAKTESDKIKKLINSNIRDYTIFCYQIEKDNLQTNGPCSVESVFAKDYSTAKIYYYNPESGKWEFKQNHLVELLPPYYTTSFFKEKFASLFKKQERLLSNELKLFAQNCESNNNIYINTTSVQFNITNKFLLQCASKEIAENKYELFFEDFGKIIPLSKDLLNSRYDISKTKPVAIVTIKDSNSLELDWKGFYNVKTNKYLHINNPFSEKQNNTTLKFCKE